MTDESTITVEQDGQPIIEGTIEPDAALDDVIQAGGDVLNQFVEPPIEPSAEEKKQIRVGGRILSLPADATEEAIATAIAEYRASPDFDASLDRDTGAPARVRMLVGSAPLDDRLANLRRFYPDAEPYDGDNFVFTDPATGKPTLYNPPGFDAGGDIASVAREGTMAVGSFLGATAGTLAGMAAGAPAGPPGMVVQGRTLGALGAGAGSAMGGELFDISTNLLMGRIDTRSPLHRTLDAGTEFFGAAAGERAGELVGAGVKRVTGGGKEAAIQLVQKFRQLRIDPPAGAASTSRTIATLEKTLDASPFSADVMQKQAETVLAQTRAAADDIVRGFGTPQTSQGAGAAIRRATTDAAERFGFTQEKAYNAAFDLIGPDTPVSVNSIRVLRETMEVELARAPRSLHGALGKTLKQLRMIELDAGVDGISFDALRQVRTMVGKNLDSPVLAGSTGAENASMRRLYGALTEDMSAAAQEAGPKAAKKLAVADRFTRQYMNTAAHTLNKIGRLDTDEQAFRYAMSATRDGGSTLARLRRNFTPEEWDVVAATVLNKMGKATPGAQTAAGDAFSVNTFMTNWSKMAPEAKKALFGGKRYTDLAPELDTLVDVMSSLKGVEKLANTSNTGRVMITWMTLQALGGALAGAVVGGDTESGVAGAAAAVIAPRVAAKLITSPAFVHWLTTPVKETSKISAHLGRLSAIAVVNPGIREEVREFMRALRSPPKARQPVGDN